MALQKQRVELTRLTVVFCNEQEYKPGDEVFVRGECMKHQYATEVFEVDGKTFILVPSDMVVACKSASTSPAPPPPTTVPSAGVPRQDEGRR